jgi:hypothetical protein
MECKCIESLLFSFSAVESMILPASERVLRVRRPPEVSDAAIADAAFGFAASSAVTSASTLCDDNYSSEEELKEIIECDRQRKKSGSSLAGLHLKIPRLAEKFSDNYVHTKLFFVDLFLTRILSVKSGRRKREAGRRCGIFCPKTFCSNQLFYNPTV